MDVEVIPPLVEYRRDQTLEQDNTALMRDRLRELKVAERVHRIVHEQRLDLANLSKSQQEENVNAMNEVLQHASQLDIAAAAQMTSSFESQAQRELTRQQQ